MFRSFLLAAAAVALAAPAASAAQQTWKIDADHSNFYFTIDHIYSKVRGSFENYSGEVVFDPADLKASKLHFVVQTDSIDTGIDKRDEHLQSADFFDASKYPTMEFTSTSVLPYCSARAMMMSAMKSSRSGFLLMKARSAP